MQFEMARGPSHNCPAISQRNNAACGWSAIRIDHVAFKGTPSSLNTISIGPLPCERMNSICGPGVSGLFKQAAIHLVGSHEVLNVWTNRKLRDCQELPERPRVRSRSSHGVPETAATKPRALSAVRKNVAGMP